MPPCLGATTQALAAFDVAAANAAANGQPGGRPASAVSRARGKCPQVPPLAAPGVATVYRYRALASCGRHAAVMQPSWGRHGAVMGPSWGRHGALIGTSWGELSGPLGCTMYGHGASLQRDSGRGAVRPRGRGVEASLGPRSPISRLPIGLRARPVGPHRWPLAATGEVSIKAPTLTARPGERRPRRGGRRRGGGRERHDDRHDDGVLHSDGRGARQAQASP